MAKLIAAGMVFLLLVLGVAIGQAADTSKAALAVVVVIFTVALSVPAWLAAALVMEQRRPRVVNNYDQRRIVIMPSSETAAPDAEDRSEIALVSSSRWSRRSNVRTESDLLLPPSDIT